MPDFPDRDSWPGENDRTKSVARPAPVPRVGMGCGGWFLLLLSAALVSTVVTALVTVALNWLLVPSGVGWKRLEYEGTVTVPFNQRFKVDYPGNFATKPSLHLEPVGPDVWFYSLDETTNSHFTVTNTTVDGRTGQGKYLTLRWKATGSRW